MKIFKYVLSFIQNFTLFFIMTILIGKFIGFTTFYIKPLSFAELFQDHLNVLIALPSILGVVSVYFQWNKDNKNNAPS